LVSGGWHISLTIRAGYFSFCLGLLRGRGITIVKIITTIVTVTVTVTIIAIIAIINILTIIAIIANITIITTMTITIVIVIIILLPKPGQRGKNRAPFPPPSFLPFLFEGEK